MNATLRDRILTMSSAATSRLAMALREAAIAGGRVSSSADRVSGLGAPAAGSGLEALCAERKNHPNTRCPK